MQSPEDRVSPPVLLRAAFGGLLSGVANLVPGISGGTMLLAAGIYPRFVRAVAAVSTLRLQAGPIALLAVVALSTGAAILLLAGPIKELVVHQRWIMYSLFIGLTLGGLPVVWRLARPRSGGLVLGAIAGFVVMALLALAQAGAGGSAVGGTGPLALGLAGLVGAAAMILPGVSGGYLLLVLGQYIPILGAVDAFKQALRAGDLGAASAPATGVLLPVAIGLVVGVAAVSNLLQRLLTRCRKPTLGFLIGLLAGAVLGLWPFQEPAEPVAGVTVIKGRVVTAETLPLTAPEDWPTRRFAPSASRAAAAVGLVAAGFVTTLGIARLGRKEPEGL